MQHRHQHQYHHLLHLPNTADFVDRLIARLSEFHHYHHHHHHHNSNNRDDQYHPHNLSSSLSPSQLSAAKPLLLTLHCLFPNELLLALDILDRRLIRHFIVHRHHHHHHHNPSPKELQPTRESFFVMSSSSSSSSSARPSQSTPPRDKQKAYQVHLHAWNCSCPAFTLSSFQSPDLMLMDPASFPWDNHSSTTTKTSPNVDNTIPIPIPVVFGGSLTKLSSHPPSSSSFSPPLPVPVPVCKHLLACILAVRCPALFDSGVQHRFVTAADLSGWCAGWAG